MPAKFWTVKELADYLGVPVSWIYDRTRRRGLDPIPHHRFGKYVRFDPESDAFQAWLSSHSTASPASAQRPN